MRSLPLILALLVLFLAPSAVAAAPRPARPALAQRVPARPVVTIHPGCRALPAGAPVRLDFVHATVDEVVAFFACVTGARFVIAEDLSARRLDLSADLPVSVEAAWEGLLAALGRAGLELVSDGEVLRVVRIVV